MKKLTFESVWKNYEKLKPQPVGVRNLKIVDYHDLKEKIIAGKDDFIEEIIDSLYSGDFYILKSAFDKKFMKDLRMNTFAYFKDQPSEFYKMLEKSPDFHRKIDIEIGKKYSINSCKHSFYFYPWNNDPLNIYL